MTKATGPREYVQDNIEKFELAAYFIVMVALATPLVSLFQRGWYAGPGNISQGAVDWLVDAGFTLATLQAFILGVVLACITAMVLDTKKRVQGILLWVGLVAVVVGFSLVGFVPSLWFALTSSGYVITIGYSITFLACTTLYTSNSFWTRVRRLEWPDTLELKLAPTLLARLLTLGVVIMWIEAHAVYPEVEILAQQGIAALHLETSYIVIDSITAFGFVLTTKRFMRYENPLNVLVLGPDKSGKTMFMYGAVTELKTQADGDTITETNLGDLSSVVSDSESGWPIPRTRSTTEQRDFTFTHGEVFPMNVNIETLDYPGERFEHLVEALADSDEIDSAIVTDLVEQFEQADVVVFLLDCERIQNNDTGELAQYEELVKRTSGKKVLFAATKADLYANEYGLSPYKNLADFADYIRTEVGEREVVKTVLSNCDQSKEDIYPVYFMTEAEDDKRVPVYQNDGLLPYGYVELLEEAL